MWYLVLCFLLAFALPVPVQVLVIALRSVAEVAKSFPNSTVFALVLGISVRVWGVFALLLEFLGCASGVAL